MTLQVTNTATSNSLHYSQGRLFVGGSATAFARLAGVVITNGGLTVSGDENHAVGSTVSGFYTNNSTSVGGTTTNQTLVNPVIAGNLTGGFGNTNGNFTNYWPGGMLVLYSPPVSGITLMQTNFANQKTILWGTNGDITTSGNMTNGGNQVAFYGGATTSGKIPIYNGTSGLNGSSALASDFSGNFSAASVTASAGLNSVSNSTSGIGTNWIGATRQIGGSLLTYNFAGSDELTIGTSGLFVLDGDLYLGTSTAATTPQFHQGAGATMNVRSNIVTMGWIAPTNGVYYRASTTSLTVANVAAGMTNGDHWTGTMSNMLMSVYMSNNVVSVFTNWSH
jgi:hypothetical protein